MTVRHTTARAPKRSAGLGTAIALGIAFLLLSMLRLAGDTLSPAFDMHFIASVLDGPVLQTRLARNVALFALALLVVHVAMGIIAWGMARASLTAFPDSKHGPAKLATLWFTLFVLWVLLANAWWFPHSALGSMHAEVARLGWKGFTLFHAASAAVGIAAGWTLLRAIRRADTRWTLAAAGCIAVLAAALLLPSSKSRSGPGALTAQARPNIIFLGIDALRVDLFDGADASRIAPHLTDFLSRAVRFDNAITPMARTFPSWISILTGLEPRRTGAIVNLLARERIHEGQTMPRLLQTSGYASLYAIDEVRFSNVDASYGFERAVTPPIGASEFLIGWFADTPLSNLVVNTRLGALLFPHVHGNRAAATTYDPDVFVAKFAGALPTRQPAFIAAHLTLAHWPFSWANSPGTFRNVGGETGEYLDAVTRVDRQFADVLEMLRSRGLLHNALLFVFSDHGEALGHADDLQDVGPLAAQLVEDHHRWGHGSSVLSPSQYRVVLGVQQFRQGRPVLENAVIDAPASVVDLAPTALEMAGVQVAAPFDGRSLAGLIRGETGVAAGFIDRIRFTETEFNPQGFSARQVAFDVLESASRLYRVDPVTDRIEVRDTLLAQVAQSRQYAAIGQRGKLVALPRVDGNGYQTLFIAQEPHGSPAPATDAQRHADVRQLLDAINGHYGLNLSPPP